MQLSIEWLPDETPPPQLLVLLHDDGADGQSMRPLAEALREAFPQAAILAPDAPHPAEPARPGEAGGGRAWRAGDDLDAALAQLLRFVRATQRRLAVGPVATALAGFGQGALLALELARLADGLAGRVLAFGGRYAALPEAAPQATTVHLLHGGADAVVDPSHARMALQHLGALHGDATLDVAQGIGHALHPSLIDSALFRLRNHIPHRTWRAALGAAAPVPASIPSADD